MGCAAPMKIQDNIYDSSAVLWNTQQSQHYTILQHCDERYDHILAVQTCLRYQQTRAVHQTNSEQSLWSYNYYLYKNKLYIFVVIHL